MKKIKVKKLVAFLLVCMFSFSLCTTVLATVQPSSVVMSVPDDAPVVMRGPKYHYKTEYFDKERTSETFRMGNQSDLGHHLDNPGDGIIYSLNEGLPTTVSVSVSLPYPYNMVSISLNLGKAYPNGGFVGGALKVLGDNPPGDYLLYVKKYLELDPYIVYEKPAGADDSQWSVYYVGALVKEYQAPQVMLVRVD